MPDFPTLARAVMEHMSIDQKALSERLDVSQPTVSRWLKGAEPKYVARLKLMRLAEECGLITPSKAAGRATIMGRVGAGAEIFSTPEQVGSEGLGEIETALPLPNGAIAFLVEGDSMYPRYDHGDVVVCWREGEAFDQVVGWEAAVKLEDGRMLLKHVATSTLPGHVNLESHNAPTIRDVQIIWASQVHSVIRAGQWSRAIRKR